MLGCASRGDPSTARPARRVRFPQYPIAWLQGRPSDPSCTCTRVGFPEAPAYQREHPRLRTSRRDDADAHLLTTRNAAVEQGCDGEECIGILVGVRIFDRSGLVDWRVRPLSEERGEQLSLDDRAIRAALLSLCRTDLPVLLGARSPFGALSRAGTMGRPTNRRLAGDSAEFSPAYEGRRHEHRNASADRA